MQKTSFPFEVIIHDDASTDGTAEIIRKYEETHPNTIKATYQKENQYSKGVGIHTTFLWPNAKGKYIAQCEGDDYWTDPYKLQKQVNYMEGNSKCSLCVHAANRVLAITRETLIPIQPSDYSRVFTTEEVIEGGGGLYSTNSMLFCTKHIDNLPSFFETSPVGDFPLTVLLAIKGNVYFMKEIMSVHRMNVPGSWTNRNRNDLPTKISLHTDLIKLLRDIDSFTENKYSDCLGIRIKYHEFMLLLCEKKYKKACSREYRQQFNALTLKQRIKLLLYSCFNKRI